MKSLLKWIPIEAIIEFLTEYLGGLIAGTVKNPTSDRARNLFKLIDALLRVLDEVNRKRSDARARALRQASDGVTPEIDIWNY